MVDLYKIKMGKGKYLVSRVLSLLTVISFAWLIVENIIIEILNFSLYENYITYFDSLICLFVLIPIVLIYNWLAFGKTTIWMEMPESKKPKPD